MTAFIPLTKAPSVKLQGLRKSYTGSASPILSDLDLEFPAGQFNVILGPSGCGKSTLLRLVAGLEEPDSGRILIGDNDVTALAPALRQCAMVFQNYALYPHMSVADNIGYSLRLAGVSKNERTVRVQDVARTLGLDGLLNRKPAQLSGGQRQRVAIGRALVRRPPVLLFDEPLCNLDSALRQEMRAELRKLHQQTGATILYVTHDQTEAMTLADRIIVLNKGQVEQIDTPQALYRTPQSTLVARLLGTPAMNILPLKRQGANDLALTDGQFLSLKLQSAGSAPADLLLGIRPEALRIADQGIRATLHSVEELGSHRLLHCEAAGERILVNHPGPLALKPGDSLHIHVNPDDVSLFDMSSNRRLPLHLQDKSK